MLCRQQYFLLSLELTSGRVISFEGPKATIAAQLLPLDHARVAIIFTDPHEALTGPLSQRQAIGIRATEVKALTYKIEVERPNGKLMIRHYKHTFDAPPALSECELVSTNGPLVEPEYLATLFRAPSLGQANGIQFEA